MNAMTSEITSPLLGQPFTQTQNKDEIKAPRHWSFLGESIGDWWIPPERSCNAENVSI